MEYARRQASAVDVNVPHRGRKPISRASFSRSGFLFLGLSALRFGLEVPAHFLAFGFPAASVHGLRDPGKLLRDFDDRVLPAPEDRQGRQGEGALGRMAADVFR